MNRSTNQSLPQANVELRAPVARSMCPAPAQSARMAEDPEASRCPSDSTGGAREGFIGKQELARRLKRSIRTVEYWQKRGIIPYVKCGRSVYYKWSAVESHLQSKFMLCRDGSKHSHKTKTYEDNRIAR